MYIVPPNSQLPISVCAYCRALPRSSLGQPTSIQTFIQVRHSMPVLVCIPACRHVFTGHCLMLTQVSGGLSASWLALYHFQRIQLSVIFARPISPFLYCALPTLTPYREVFLTTKWWLSIASLTTSFLCVSHSMHAGYAFLLFREEASVHRLVKNCLTEEGKLYMFVSSLTQTNKKVSHRHTYGLFTN